MAGAISPRAPRALIALGAAAVLAPWWHSTLAVSGLTSGHAIAITWGYAVTAHADPASETATLLSTCPGVAMAAVAWFLLLGTGAGPVQVQLVVRSTRIATVNILEQPSSAEHDLQTGQLAFPRLIGETIAAQSARIDTVSGATDSSGGYIKSLQSALDNGA